MTFLPSTASLAAGATVIASALAVSVVLATEGYDFTEYIDLSSVSVVPLTLPADTTAPSLKAGAAKDWSEEWREVQKTIPSSRFDSRPAETF
jgi:hypothetical protein